MKKAWLTLLLSLAVVLPASMNLAKAANNKKDQTEPAAQRINLFQAMEEGLVEVELSPKNAMECSVSVKNKTNKPLLVDMPSTFAGVPVVAQPGGRGGMGGGMMGGMGGPMGGMMGGPMGGMGMGGELDGGLGGRNRGRDSMGGGSGSNSGGGNQSFGGGMGGGSMGGGSRGGMGGGRGGNMFSIAPEKTVKEKVRTVCLEHGKKDPNPNVQYTMVPLESYTDNKTTQALCAMLGDNEVDQYALQAAVWSEENGLTFDEMAEKTTRSSGLEAPRPFFQPNEIALGRQILSKAVEEARSIEEQEQQEDMEQVDIVEEEKALRESGTSEDQTIENLTDQLLSK